MFRDLEKAQTSFTGIAAHRNFGGSLGYQGTSQSGEGLLVSGSYFPVLGLTPALGRLLTPEDDKTVGTHFVAVLSHDYWNSRFTLNPNVLERDAGYQRTGDDHRRRGAARLQRHGARQQPRRVRAAHACAA